MRCLPLRPQSQVLICETAVFARLGGYAVRPCFARNVFLFTFCWNNEGKTRTAASLQTNGTRQGPAVLYNLLGQQSRMLMSEQQFLIFYNEMLTIETAVSNAHL